MIYLANITSSQLVYIPKGKGNSLSDALHLTIVGTVNKEEYEFNVTDSQESNQYFRFGVTLPEDIELGEYQYSLMDTDGTELSCGILMITKSETNPKEFDKEITYKQYGE